MTGSIFVRCVFILCMLEHSVHSRGFIETNFKEFINYEGKRFDGTCCDKPGFWSWGASKDKCTDECDHTFVICMGNGTQSSSMSACEFGQQELEGAGGNRITFNSHVGKAVNPVKFAFGTWPGVVKVKIDVHDNDGDDGYDFVDHFEYQYNTRDLRREIDAAQESLVLTGTRTRFDLELKVYCDMNFYGPNCDTFCKETDDATGHFKCDPSTGAKICKSGWKGSDCLENIDDCVGNRCYFGSTCIDGINYYSCLCPPGRTGLICEAEINECASSPCLNGGKCTDESNGFSCKCATGFAGLLCDVEIDECRSGPCLNGGSCEDKIASYSCACRSGFQGDRCEIDLNECLSNPCYQAERCVDLPGDYRCECLSGFSGKNCEYNINECSSRPCKNNGLCIDQLNSFRCKCEYGFTGIMCEERVNFCDPNFCKNGATCTSLDADFECECPEGFTGTWCELDVNECEGKSDICGLNGNCINTIGSYDCDCFSGFDGKFCETEIDECNKTEEPCSNEGLCIDMVGEYRCECSGTGFQGNRCEIEINECESSPCDNAGICVDMFNGFVCVCPLGFYGITCALTTTSSTLISSSTPITKPTSTSEPNITTEMLDETFLSLVTSTFHFNVTRDIFKHNITADSKYNETLTATESTHVRSDTESLNDSITTKDEFTLSTKFPVYQEYNRSESTEELSVSHTYSTILSTYIKKATDYTTIDETSEYLSTGVAIETTKYPKSEVTIKPTKYPTLVDINETMVYPATEFEIEKIDANDTQEYTPSGDDIGKVEYPSSGDDTGRIEYPSSADDIETVEYSSSGDHIETVEFPLSGDDIETVEYPSSGDKNETVEYPSSGDDIGKVEYLSSGDDIEAVEYPSSDDDNETVEYPSSGDDIETVEFSSSGDDIETVEYPSSGDDIKTVEYPSSGDDIEPVEYPSSGDDHETVEYPSSGYEIETVKYPSSGYEIETVKYPSSGDDIETVEYPSSGDGMKTVEYPSSSNEIETVEYPSSGYEIETVDNPSSGDEIETVEYLSSGDGNETVEYPSSGDEIEKVEYPLSGDDIETVGYPSSGDGNETVEYPSSGDMIETVEYPTSGDDTETAEYPSSGDGIETVKYPSSGDEIETEYPSSGDEIKTIEYPSSGDEIETVEFPSSGDDIEAVEFPTSGDGNETVEYPSSFDDIETVEYPSSGDEIETVEYPSSGDDIETVEYPSSGDDIETVEYSSSGDDIETVGYPSSGDHIETVEYPTSVDDIETVEYPSSGADIEIVEYPSSGDEIETVQYLSSGDDIGKIEYPASGDDIEIVEHPSSGDDIETVEFPSSGDDNKTVEYPSSGDDIGKVEYLLSGDDIETVEYPSSGDDIEKVKYPSFDYNIKTVEYPSSGDDIQTVKYPSFGDDIEPVEYPSSTDGFKKETGLKYVSASDHTSSVNAIESSTHTRKSETMSVIDKSFDSDSNTSSNITDTTQTTKEHYIWTSVQTVIEDMNNVTFEYIEYNIEGSGEDSFIEYQTKKSKSSTISLPSSVISSSSQFLGKTTKADNETTDSSQSMEAVQGSGDMPDTPLDSLEGYYILTTESTETLNKTTLKASSETTAIYNYLFTSTHKNHTLDLATLEIDSADTVTSGINITKSDQFFKSPFQANQTTLTSENTTLSNDIKNITRTEYDIKTTLSKDETTFKPDTIDTSYTVPTDKLNEVVPTTSKVSTESSKQSSVVTEKTKESVLNPWIAARKHLQSTSSPNTAVPTKERLNPRNPWIAARKHLGRMGPSTEVSAKTSRTKQSEVTIPSTLSHSYSDFDVSTTHMTGRVSLGELTTDEETLEEFLTHTDVDVTTESKSDEPYPGMSSPVEATSSAEKDEILSLATLPWPFDVTFSSTFSLGDTTTDYDLTVEKTSTVYHDHTSVEATKDETIGPQHTTGISKMSLQTTTKTTELISDITKDTGVTEQVTTIPDSSYAFAQSASGFETTTPQQFSRETYNTAENAYSQFETTDLTEKSTLDETTSRESNYTAETMNIFETDLLSSTGSDLTTDITSTVNTTTISRSLSSDKTVFTSIKQDNRTVTTGSTKSTSPFPCNKCGPIPTIPRPEMTKAIEIYDVLVADFQLENETKGMTDQLETILFTFLEMKTTFPTGVTESSPDASILKNVTMFPHKDIKEESTTIDRETTAADRESIRGTLKAKETESKPSKPGVETDNQKLSSSTSLTDMTYSLIPSVASPKQTVDTRTLSSTLFTNVSSSSSQTIVSLSEITDINMKSSTTIESEEINNLNKSKPFSDLLTTTSVSEVSLQTPSTLFVSLTTGTFYENDSKSIITDTDFTEDSTSTTPLSTTDETALTGAYSSSYKTSTLFTESSTTKSTPLASKSTSSAAILSSSAETKLRATERFTPEIFKISHSLLPTTLPVASTQSAVEISPEAKKSTSKIITQTVNTETRSTEEVMSSILGTYSTKHFVKPISIKSSSTTREKLETSSSDMETQTQLLKSTATFDDTGAYYESSSESEITEIYLNSVASTEADEIKYLAKSEPVSSLSTTASSSSSETTLPSSPLTLLTTETVYEYDTKRIKPTSIKPSTITREELETHALDIETQTQLLKTTATFDDTGTIYESSSEFKTTEIHVTSAAATEAEEIKYLTTLEPFPISSTTSSSASSETTTLSSSLTLLTTGTDEYDTKRMIQDIDFTGDLKQLLNLSAIAENASAHVDYSTFKSHTSYAKFTLPPLEYTSSATLQSTAESEPTATESTFESDTYSTFVEFAFSAADSTLQGKTSAPSALDISSKATTSTLTPESLSPAIDTEAVSFSSSFSTKHASKQTSSKPSKSLSDLSENRVIINAINETLDNDDLFLMRILTEPGDLGTTEITPPETEVPVKFTTESRKTKKTKSTRAETKSTKKFPSSTTDIHDASSLRHQSYYTAEHTSSNIVTTSIAKTQPEDIDLPTHAGMTTVYTVKTQLEDIDLPTHVGNTTVYTVKTQPGEMISVPLLIENATSEYTTEASTAYIKGGAIKLSVSENEKYREQTTFLPTVTTAEPTTRKLSVIRHELDLTSNNTYPHPRKEIFEYDRDENITKGPAKLTFQKIRVTVIRAYDAGKQVVLQTYQKVKDIATTVVVTTYKRSRELLEKALYRIEALWKYCTEGIDHYIVQPLLNAKLFVKHKFDQTYARLSKLFETGQEILKRTAEDTRKETLTYFDTLTEYYTDVYRQYSAEVRDIFESLKVP